MSYKLVGFDLTKIVDEIGDNWSILSIDTRDYSESPIPYYLIPSIKDWSNSGTLVTGDDGDVWLRQTILDHENPSPMPTNQIVMVIRNDVDQSEYNISSFDFIGGRPPHRPTT